MTLVNLLTIIVIGFYEFSFSRISESTTGYTSHVGSYFPWHRHLIEGTTFSVSSQRHMQMWGETNSLSLKTAVVGSEPLTPRLTIWRSTM